MNLGSKHRNKIQAGKPQIEYSHSPLLTNLFSTLPWYVYKHHPNERLLFRFLDLSGLTIHTSCSQHPYTYLSETCLSQLCTDSSITLNMKYLSFQGETLLGKVVVCICSVERSQKGAIVIIWCSSWMAGELEFILPVQTKYCKAFKFLLVSIILR